MTDSQLPHAPVLRRHREMAALAFYGDNAWLVRLCEHWISTGTRLGNERLHRIAQLAADCESRGESGALNRAWEEGRQAAPYCSARQERPHGGGITHYECKACEYGDVRYPGDEDWDDSAPTEPAIVNPYPKAPYQLKENERE